MLYINFSKNFCLLFELCRVKMEGYVLMQKIRTSVRAPKTGLDKTAQARIYNTGFLFVM